MKTHKLTKAEIGRRVARNPNHPWRYRRSAQSHGKAAANRVSVSGKAVAKG